MNLSQWKPVFPAFSASFEQDSDDPLRTNPPFSFRPHKKKFLDPSEISFCSLPIPENMFQKLISISNWSQTICKEENR